jgi:hypothetical protein
MISTLTLVSLGLVVTSGIEIVTVIDPAKAEIADIDAAVRDYAESAIDARELGYEIPADAVTENVVNASDQGGAASSASYRSDEPRPPVPPMLEDSHAVPSPQAEVAISLETLKLDQPFVVLRKEERPAWVEQPPQLKGSAEHFVSVASDPVKTDLEASEALAKEIREAVDNYINDQIGRSDAARRIHLSPDVASQLVVERYAEDLQFADNAIGPMKQVHARLVFTPQFRAEIVERWKEHVVNARLLRTGLGATGVLLVLVMMFGFLKRIGGRR